jgi:hypothetical protein
MFNARYQIRHGNSLNRGLMPLILIKIQLAGNREQTSPSLICELI